MFRRLCSCFKKKEPLLDESVFEEVVIEYPYTGGLNEVVVET
jgi:hypothetical protein